MSDNTKSGTVLVRHKFRDHQIDSKTKILIVGTFNPCAATNNADFFYSRQVRRPNELWRLLPKAFGSEDLTGLNRVDEKKQFMKQNRIDFIDVVEEIQVSVDQKNNVKDAFIDKKVTKWRDVIGEMEKLNLDCACFTRSTFNDIPRINLRIVDIEEYCKKRKIKFGRIVTPSPVFPSEKKQDEWSQFFNQSAPEHSKS